MGSGRRPVALRGALWKAPSSPPLTSSASEIECVSDKPDLKAGAREADMLSGDRRILSSTMGGVVPPLIREELACRKLSVASAELRRDARAGLRGATSMR